MFVQPLLNDLSMFQIPFENLNILGTLKQNELGQVLNSRLADFLDQVLLILGK